MELSFLLGLVSLFYTVMEITAIITAVIAVRETRTPQGAIAWALFLATFPMVSLPLYWIFGRTKFHGYTETMRTGWAEFRQLIGNRHEIPSVRPHWEHKGQCTPRNIFETLANIPFMGGNNIQLLVDGKATFEAIFAGIESAQTYILLQFYIVHDDSLGKRLQALLLKKAEEGVRINFLYDEIGSHATPTAYWDTLREAGIEAHSFHTTKGPGNRFQLNFRNHRKIVVIDGHTAYVGGHNVGDEYLGITSRFKGWRDTHIRLQGPAVLGVQVSFGKDWYWATHRLPTLDLSMPESAGTVDVLSLATGPADSLESCSMMFIQAIDAAKHRFWIASPYFVPDGSVIKALQMAALRGVDVRIMLPRKPDHMLVYLAGFASLKDLSLPGVRVYRYDAGFLHQKVFLTDNTLAGVGTANLDNRSFRLNFEITMLIEDETFCKEIEQMFLKDFALSTETGPDEYDRKSIAYQTVVRFARLLSPIL